MVCEVAILLLNRSRARHAVGEGSSSASLFPRSGPICAVVTPSRHPIILCL